MLRPLAGMRLRGQCIVRMYSSVLTSTPSTSPLLVKIREDMKTSMRAKDSARLDVLRGLISDITNAAKMSETLITDAHVLQMLRKRVKGSEGAAQEAENASRQDLLDKEVRQIAILDSYIKDSIVISEEDLKRAVQEAVSNIRTEGRKRNKGSVMKALFGPGGALDGQLCDKKEVSVIVDGML